MVEHTRDERENFRLLAGVLTIVSGVLVVVPAIVSLLAEWPDLQRISRVVVSGMISGFAASVLISGVAIVGGVILLARKNLIAGVIGAAIPLGIAIYDTLLESVMFAYVLSGAEELPKGPTVLSYVAWPSILVLSVLSLFFLAKSKKRED